MTLSEVAAGKAQQEVGYGVIAIGVGPDGAVTDAKEPVKVAVPPVAYLLAILNRL